MLRPNGRSIRGQLRHLWRDTTASSPYMPASSVIRFAQESNFERAQLGFDHALLSWILVVDEISLWISSISMAMDEGEPPADKRSLVCRFMLGGLAAQINAVRMLVIGGFDIPAKMLVRQIEEQCALLIWIMDDEELCAEFHRDHDPENSNKFWHRHISKGKIDKKITEKLTRENPKAAEAFSEIAEWFKTERVVLSAASHPSFLASAMTVAAGVSSARGGAGIFGFADAVSVRTLRILFFQLFTLIFAQQASFDFFVGRFDENSDNPFVTIAIERRKYIYRLFLFVAKFHDELPLGAQFVDDIDEVA